MHAISIRSWKERALQFRGAPLVTMVVLSALLVALSADAATAAMRDDPQVRLTSADQKFARAVVLRKADLPDLNLSEAWKGSELRGDAFSCPGHAQSELVVTGAASSSFALGRVVNIDSNVRVVQTNEMVQLNLQRPASIPQLQCIRDRYDRGPASVRLVSVSRLPGFPRVTPHASAIRVVYDYTEKGQTTRLIHDWVNVIENRIEISLVLATAYAARDAVKALEVSLAKILVGRAAETSLLSSARFTDRAGDAGTAPDLTGLTVTYQGDDVLMFEVRWAGAGDLPEGMSVGLDTDRNPATGGVNGAEYLIQLDPLIQILPATVNGKPGGVHPSFLRWNGSRFVRISVGLISAAADKGWATVFVCLCDLNEPTSFNVFARSEIVGSSDTDMLPDAGPARLDLPVVYSVLSAHPPAVAGQPFELLIQGVRLVNASGPVVAPQTATCSAKLAGKTLAPSGRCRWLLPPSTRGRQLIVSYEVVYKGATSTFDRSYRIG